MTKKILFTAYLCLLSSIHVINAQSTVYLTQIYGGGGNSGAPYRADFIELYNSSNDAVNISNWQIFYASKNNAYAGDSIVIEKESWIQANDHYLIQCKEGINGASIMGDTHWENLNMSATGGKILIQKTGIAPNFNSIDQGNKNFIDYINYSGSNTKSYQRVKENGKYCRGSIINLNFKKINVCPYYLKTSTNIPTLNTIEESTVDIYLLSGYIFKKNILLSEVDLPKGKYIIKEKNKTYILRL